MLVEIRDALLVDPELATSLGQGDIQVLAEAEEYLGTPVSKPGHWGARTPITGEMKS
jgi:hypothetical protein